jgi:hypothetical protein
MTGRGAAGHADCAGAATVIRGTAVVKKTVHGTGSAVPLKLGARRPEVPPAAFFGRGVAAFSIVFAAERGGELID